MQTNNRVGGGINRHPLKNKGVLTAKLIILIVVAVVVVLLVLKVLAAIGILKDVNKAEEQAIKSEAYNYAVGVQKAIAFSDKDELLRSATCTVAGSGKTLNCSTSEGIVTLDVDSYSSPQKDGGTITLSSKWDIVSAELTFVKDKEYKVSIYENDTDEFVVTLK